VRYICIGGSGEGLETTWSPSSNHLYHHPHPPTVPKPGTSPQALTPHPNHFIASRNSKVW